jgi:type III pantothenate kinase
MILCIDIGNTQIHFGIFLDNKILMQFRYSSNDGVSSDQLGIFMKNVIFENEINFTDIKQIAICSVVPELDYAMRSACVKYFKIDPFFLAVGAKTGLKIKYSNPSEVGADRIATAVGATNILPHKNIIVVDMGTATTICAITKDKEYLGGAIFTGMKTSIRALYSNTSKLPSVEIIKPKFKLGRTTKENIQIGIYYGQLGAMKTTIDYVASEAFVDEKYAIIGTGGFAELYRDEKFFDIIIPELVLIGLKNIACYN